MERNLIKKNQLEKNIKNNSSQSTKLMTQVIKPR
jgi:hypothetical protein